MKKHLLMLAVLLPACAAPDKKAEAPKDADPRVAAIQDSIAKDTANWMLYTHLADELRHKGRYDEAGAAAEKGFMLAPSPGTEARLEMAKVMAAADKGAAAINLVKEVEKAKKNNGVPADEVQIAEVYAILGDTAAVFRWLERGIQANTPSIQTVKSDREFLGYQKHQKWEALFGKM